MALVLFIATFPLHSELFLLPLAILGGGGVKNLNSLEARIETLKKDFLGVTKIERENL